jgi:sugar transferase (PEP-CTERM/EpsH1 system associated)
VNILYVCHRFPYPPKRGGKIRPFNMIHHLSANHRVIVASLVRSDNEAEEGRGLAAFCAGFRMARVHDSVQGLRMVARLPTSMPSSMGYFYSGEMARNIAELRASERFDLIFVHCSSVAQYVEGVNDSPKILDFGDMDSQKWLEYARYKPFPLSVGYALEGRKLAREERQLATCFDLCTTTTRAERGTLDGYGIKVPTDWFPNGVDNVYFAPDGTAHAADEIAFVGRMDYYPNQECMFDFCANTLPLLRARRPGIRLSIVGANPPLAVRRLGKLENVTVTGSVPDVRPFLRKAALMVAPLNIARGTQNKILEAMALGVPVVTSRLAAGGVDAVAPDHLLVADTPADFCEAILSIVGDRRERQRLAEAGRARMLSHHAWAPSMRRLDRIIERCLSLGSHHAPPAPVLAERAKVRIA